MKCPRQSEAGTGGQFRLCEIRSSAGTDNICSGRWQHCQRALATFAAGADNTRHAFSLPLGYVLSPLQVRPLSASDTSSLPFRYVLSQAWSYSWNVKRVFLPAAGRMHDHDTQPLQADAGGRYMVRTAATVLSRKPVTIVTIGYATFPYRKLFNRLLNVFPLYESYIFYRHYRHQTSECRAALYYTILAYDVAFVCEYLTC